MEDVGLTTVIGGKAGKTYAFMQEGNLSIGAAKLKGYKMVKQSENPDLNVPAGEITPEGHIRVGDTVLMEIDTSQREEMRREKTARMDKMLRRSKDDFHRKGQEEGVKTFEEGPSEFSEAEERKTYEASGKKTFAMKASINPVTKEVVK